MAGEEDRKRGGAVGQRIRQPWRPFDDGAREDFLQAITTGAANTVADACRLLMLSYITVQSWLRRGKRTDYTDDDLPYRIFWLRLQQAKAARRNVARHVVMTHILDSPKLAIEVLKIDQRQEQLESEREERNAKIAVLREQQRTARAQADMAEARAAKILAASEAGDDAFGLVPVLMDERLSEQTRRELAEHAVRMGWIAVQRADLAADPNED